MGQAELDDRQQFLAANSFRDLMPGGSQQLRLSASQPFIGFSQ